MIYDQIKIISREEESGKVQVGDKIYEVKEPEITIIASLVARIAAMERDFVNLHSKIQQEII